jgi:protein ImuA
MSEPSASPVAFPTACAPLEEACAEGPRAWAAALAFAAARGGEGDERPVLVCARRAWLGETGRPYGPGFPGGPPLIVSVATEAEGLWAMEQALRSGAVRLAVGALETATLAQTRRLEFAARDGGAAGVLLKSGPEGLSAARRRWRIRPVAGRGDPDDPRAPGPFAFVAELTRSRLEKPAAWMLEMDDETHRLRVADRLADFGLAAVGGRAA